MSDQSFFSSHSYGQPIPGWPRRLTTDRAYLVEDQVPQGLDIARRRHADLNRRYDDPRVRIGSYVDTIIDPKSVRGLIQ